MWGIFVFCIELSLTLALAIWLRSTSRGETISWNLIARLLLFGGLSAIIAAFVQVNYSLSPESVAVYAPDFANRHHAALIISNNFIASLTEEVAKYFVAILMVTQARRLTRVSDGLVYLIIIGLGFSLVEDALYLLDPNVAPVYRLISFYLHSGTSAIIGYAFGKFVFKLGGYRQLCVALITSVALHFGYNTVTELANPWIAAILTFLTLLLITLQIFILFRRALLDEVRQDQKIRRTSHRLLNA